MKIHVPDLAEVTSLNPVVILVAGAALAGFLVALLLTWLLVWLGRRQVRLASLAPRPARAARTATAPAAARTDPVLLLHHEPAPMPMPAILLLSPPEPAAEPVQTPRERPSLLDYLPGNIEPWPKPRMAFLEPGQKSPEPAAAEPVPVPALARSHTPQAAQSIGLPEAAWDRSHVLELRPEQAVPARPPARLLDPDPPKPPAKLLGLIKLKPRARENMGKHGENSAVRYSRRVG